MGVWNRSNHRSWHLIRTLTPPDLPQSPTSLSMDVGVDTHDFVRGTMTKSLPAAFANLS
jgi:hypothetical protein